MNQKEVNMSNVDDYIRNRKRVFNAKACGGRLKIYWGKKALEYFEAFVHASWPIEFGYKLPDTVHGLTYMGVKHYIRK